MSDKRFNLSLILLVAIAAVIGQSNILGYGQPVPVEFDPLPPLSVAERAAHPSASELATWSNSHNFGTMHILLAGMFCLAVAIAATAIHAQIIRRRRLLQTT